MIVRLCRRYSSAADWKNRIYTGLYRDKEAVEKLKTVYSGSLEALSHIPDCYYRRSMSKTLADRVNNLVNEGEEGVLGWNEGRVEEVLEQATAELSLIQKMKNGEFRVWEDLEVLPPSDQWSTNTSS